MSLCKPEEINNNPHETYQVVLLSGITSIFIVADSYEKAAEEGALNLHILRHTQPNYQDIDVSVRLVADDLSEYTRSFRIDVNTFRGVEDFAGMTQVVLNAEAMPLSDFH